MMGSPIYKHDCEGACVYLGTTRGRGDEWFDWYVHPHESHDDILGRYGSDGPDYLSYYPETLSHNPVAACLYYLWKQSRKGSV